MEWAAAAEVTQMVKMVRHERDVQIETGIALYG
jgi:hypothetical protein